mmetsp:Transcript_75676/g.234796  ORF Transcript_75676/g.234796 Transcript_75676/m.234796 type:complete len:761 (-) Transcript_75676:176-2458(-)
MSVTFVVECRETRPGDAVFLLGSHDALGNWSPGLAFPLETTAETFPSWSSEPLKLPPGQPVEFKFVVQREDRTGAVTWETLQATNRSVTPAAGKLTTAKTAWGSAAVEVSEAPEPVQRRPRAKTEEEQLSARHAEEKKLLRMAESSVDAAAAEVPEASQVASQLLKREPMRRNFSQSLICVDEAPAEEEEEAAAPSPKAPTPKAATPKAGEAPVRGVALKHISSFSALSIMAEAAEKDEARLVHKAQASAQYEPHNLNVPVVVVTSEFAPYSKTGGLGLVAASYSYEFPRSGHRCMVVSPKYKHFEGITLIGETSVFVSGQQHTVKYWHKFAAGSSGGGCDCVFVDHPSIERGGGLYNDDEGREYPDNLFRFTLLSLAAMEAPLVLSFDGFKYGDKVIFLANDWQAGLVPLYMNYKYRPNGTYTQSRTIYVIHNLGYQGAYHGISACEFFGINGQAASDLALGNSVNLSKAALICTDRVLTVSPNYAQEIQSPAGGFGLQDFVRAKAAALRLAGILNGIDDCWDPQTDKQISKNYTVEDFEEGKRENKAALQNELGLNEDDCVLLIGFVGRLSWQKGVDLLGSIIPWLMEDTGNGVTGQVQLIMMGNGERQYATVLREAEQRYPGKVCGYVGFDPKTEHKIMAGCDIFLMPSRYEPCGLPQMICQQYGTLPIVTATGGLTDSVKDVSMGPNVATGFFVDPLEANKMKEVVYRAADLFLKHPAEFKCMQRTAMLTDFYWPRAMDEYERHIDFTLFDPPNTR